MSEKYVKLDDIQNMLKELNGELQKAKKNPYSFIDVNLISCNLPTVELPHWHDLRKDPEDLPSITGEYITYVSYDGCEYNDICEYNCDSIFSGWDYTRNVKVIKWCELPKDED